MKRRIVILFIAAASLPFLHSCEYINDIGSGSVSVITVPANSITSISALSGGVVRSDAGSPVLVRGICWSIETAPSVNLSTKTSDSTGTISFRSSMVNLLPNTVYFVRAYAENKEGTYYGNEISFQTTQPSIPELTTAKTSFITGSSALSGGEIINDGGSPVKSRGVCWSTSANPLTRSGFMTIDSSGTGNFTSHLFGLEANKIYYLRAYAINNVGTAYGDEISFNTSPASLALIQTGIPTGIARNTAIVPATLADDGGSAVTGRGICWGESPDPTTDKCNKTTNGTGSGTFSGILTGLTAGKKYYARAYAINSPGISYGNTVCFQTEMPVLPVVFTISPFSILYYGAGSGGNVVSDGGSPVTARGICWSTSENPTVLLNTKTVDGTGSGLFTSQISGLAANTYYYARSYATGIAGTAYGSQILFKTLNITLPVVSTGLVSEITQTSVRAEGIVSSDGGAEVLERGICIGTIKNVSADQGIKIVSGSGTGSFSCYIQRLVPGTVYYLRSYARNSEGMSYGNEFSFTTAAGQLKQGIGMSFLDLSISGNGVLTDATGWHYYAFTKGADRTGKIYIDGVLVAQGVFRNVEYFYSSLFLGAGFSSEWSGFYKGWLDELRVSGVVRTDEEIKEYFNSNMPFICDAGTLGLYHFNEGDGSVIKSSTGASGTLYNGVKFTGGRFLAGLYFDGTDDRGDCNLNIPEDKVTIEFWAKPDGIQAATIIQPYGFFSSDIFLNIVSVN